MYKTRLPIQAYDFLSEIAILIFKPFTKSTPPAAKRLELIYFPFLYLSVKHYSEHNWRGLLEIHKLLLDSLFHI